MQYRILILDENNNYRYNQSITTPYQFCIGDKIKIATDNFIIIDDIYYDGQYDVINLLCKKLDKDIQADTIKKAKKII